MANIDCPRSPCRTRHAHWPKRARNGWSERVANAFDVGRARLVAGDDRRRVPGREVEQAKDEQRHECYNWDGGGASTRTREFAFSNLTKLRHIRVVGPYRDTGAALLLQEIAVPRPSNIEFSKCIHDMVECWELLPR